MKVEEVVDQVLHLSKDTQQLHRSLSLSRFYHNQHHHHHSCHLNHHHTFHHDRLHIPTYSSSSPHVMLENQQFSSKRNYLTVPSHHKDDIISPLPRRASSSANHEKGSDCHNDMEMGAGAAGKGEHCSLNKLPS